MMNDSEKLKCPECKNSSFDGFREERCFVIRCNECNNVIAATTFTPNEVHFDVIVYEIKINNLNYKNIQHIKVIAFIKKCNYLAARKLLELSQSITLNAKAEFISEIKEILTFAEIDFVIQPEFVIDKL